MSPSDPYDHPDDTRLAQLADRQHVVVAVRQLRALGFSKQSIRTRVKRGRLHRRHRGVYAVGHSKLTLNGHRMAAVLACGPGAVLSHRAAGALHDLRGSETGPIDVTAPTRHNIEGIRCHYVRNLDPRDVTEVDAIPVTSIPRTLLDLAESLSAQQLLYLLEAAQRQDVLNFIAVDELIDRSPGRHGMRPLRNGVSRLRDEPDHSRSRLERQFRRIVAEHRFPEPQANVVVEGEDVDFYWPEHHLIVEVDGYRFHKTKLRFERDRAKDAKLTMLGYRVVRFTYTRVMEQPKTVARDLAALLALSVGSARAASGR